MAEQILDEHVPWGRQTGEPGRAYHAFAHYRDLGPKRSVVRAWRLHKTDCEHVQVPENRCAPNRWQAWSAGRGWVERSELWDAELDRQGREKAARAQVEARERHARLAQGTLKMLSTPAFALLEALADPNVIQQLTAKARSGSEGTIALLGVIIRCARVIPPLVTMERQALGLSPERVELEDRRDITSFGNRIVRDPVATDLAIALLDRLAGTGPCAPSVSTIL